VGKLIGHFVVEEKIGDGRAGELGVGSGRSLVFGDEQIVGDVAEALEV